MSTTTGNQHRSQGSLSHRDSSSSLASLSSRDSSSSSSSFSQMPRRTKTSLNPVMSAMLRSNTLRDCHQVRDMISQCQSSGIVGPDTDSFVCKTAEKYFLQCTQGGV